MGCCELHNCILLLLPFELDLLYAFFSWVTEFFSATMSQATNKEKASSPYSWKKCKKFWGELWTPAESPPWHQKCTHQCYAEAPGGLCCFLLYYSSSSTTTAKNATQNQQFLSNKEAELVVLSLVLVLLLVTEYWMLGYNYFLLQPCQAPSFYVFHDLPLINSSWQMQSEWWVVRIMMCHVYCVQ